MKKIFSTTLCALAIYMSGSQTTHAIFCANCSQFVTQIPQYAQDLISAGANVAVNANTYASTYKITIMDPLAKVMISFAQQEAAKNIVSWANGGFQGTSLIISSPERYIQNKGTEAVKGLMTNIPKESVYGESLFSALVNDTKYNNPDTQLASLSQSSIPSIVQDKACNDQALSSEARDDVTNGGTLEFDQVAFTTRKEDLYSFYGCDHSPSTDPELSRRLTEVNKQNPSVGGWDSWLAMTGGENDYTKVTKALIIKNKVQEERKANTKEDLTRGGGVASDQKCTEYYPSTDEGWDSELAMTGEGGSTNNQPLCKTWSVVTPSGTVQNSVSKATTAGLDRLTGLQSDFSSIITGFATSFLMKGLNAAFSSNSNNAIPPIITTAPAQDLLNDPTRKEQLINPIKKLLNTHLSSLNDLGITDQNYISEVNSYKSQVENIHVCYNALVLDFPNLEGNPTITAAQGFYNSQSVSLNAVIAKINNELGLISETKTLITGTLSFISTSNSTTEISTKITNYQNQVDSRGLPTSMTAGAREGEYQIFKGKAQVETMEGGSITNLTNQCSTIRFQQTLGSNNG